MKRHLGALAVALIALTPTLIAQDLETVRTADGLVELTIPTSWQPIELNAEADLQFGDPGEEIYLIVLNDIKEDLYGWNIDKHSRVTLGSLLSSVAFPKVVGPKSLTIDDHPAIQYEIRGAIENINVIYTHTTIETPDALVQVLAWTLPSRHKKNQPILDQVIESFQSASSE